MAKTISPTCVKLGISRASSSDLMLIVLRRSSTRERTGLPLVSVLGCPSRTWPTLSCGFLRRTEVRLWQPCHSGSHMTSVHVNLSTRAGVPVKFGIQDSVVIVGTLPWLACEDNVLGRTVRNGCSGGNNALAVNALFKILAFPSPVLSACGCKACSLASGHACSISSASPKQTPIRSQELPTRE
jgi:hypothetical protein